MLVVVVEAGAEPAAMAVEAEAVALEVVVLMQREQMGMLTPVVEVAVRLVPPVAAVTVVPVL
jgi:hypothetical protein